jgi:hypothetical protein
VTQGPTVNGIVFLTIHKRLENTGDVPIDIAAEAVDVYGEKLANSRIRAKRIETPNAAEVVADVPRRPVALLYSAVKLRSGAVGGNPKTSFFLPAHSSAEEVFLIAVPARTYPVVLVRHIDFILKAPIRPRVDVRIVRTLLGGYWLKAATLDGEYDNLDEYPIKP